MRETSNVYRKCNELLDYCQKIIHKQARKYATREFACEQNFKMKLTASLAPLVRLSNSEYLQNKLTQMNLRQ